MIQVIINQQMMDQVVKNKTNNNQVLDRTDSYAVLKANQRDIAAVIAKSRILFNNTMVLK
ncbi:hypothetical protein [uncultured Shewanella sp.]|uniref:hypothetical protein n=1 Tax=uncultured Shewanella sp. TaxID=173975 RepID=UPI00261F71C5|nr:hypothetical protein [uncultured Shewanella sp.]